MARKRKKAGRKKQKSSSISGLDLGFDVDFGSFSGSSGTSGYKDVFSEPLSFGSITSPFKQARRNIERARKGLSALRGKPASYKQAYLREKRELKRKLEEDRYKLKYEKIKEAKKAYERAKKQEQIYKAKQAIGGFISKLKSLKKKK